MNYEKRRTLFENLKILVKSEYEEVFRILKRNREEWTENSNGIFFDMAAIKEQTMGQLTEYMGFCLENRKAEERRASQLASLGTELNQCLTEGYRPVGT
jgi:hypothetical protein